MRLIRAGVQKTEQNLKGFEQKYHKNTEKFIADYEADKLEETIDFIEWIGEFRMLERCRVNAIKLRNIPNLKVWTPFQI